MKRFGEALKEIVGEGFQAEERKGKVESVLMNPNRQRIFQLLFSRPCSTAKAVASETKLSLPSVKWHLRKLVEAKYLEERIGGGRRIYCPSGLLRDEEAIQILASLSEDKLAKTFTFIAKRGGSTLLDVRKEFGVSLNTCRIRLSKLKEMGLVTSVIDGRYRRYFATDLIQNIENRNRKALRNFRRSLLKKLQEDRLNPRVQWSRSRETEVEIEVGGKKSILKIPSRTLTHIF